MVATDAESRALSISISCLFVLGIGCGSSGDGGTDTDAATSDATALTGPDEESTVGEATGTLGDTTEASTDTTEASTGTTEASAGTTEASTGTTEASTDTSGGSQPDLCVAICEKHIECSEPWNDFQVKDCYAIAGTYENFYGPECYAAWEAYVICRLALPCEEYLGDPPGPCLAEDEIFDATCVE